MIITVAPRFSPLYRCAGFLAAAAPTMKILFDNTPTTPRPFRAMAHAHAEEKATPRRGSAGMADFDEARQVAAVTRLLRMLLAAMRMMRRDAARYDGRAHAPLRGDRRSPTERTCPEGF